MKILKNYRENEIKWYLLSYLFLVIGINNPALLTTDVDMTTKVVAVFTSAFFTGAICSLAFVLDSLYSSKVKDLLLFMGFTKIPGSTIFTRISSGKVKDKRIENAMAVKKYEEIILAIPKDKGQREQFENTKWFRLYVKHKDDNSVLSVHRDSLLTRDLYITTISIAVLTGVMMAVCLIGFNWIICGYLLIMLILTNIAARNKAHRYVNTVIAIDIASAE